MDTLEYEGKIYNRYNSNWIDSDNMIVNISLQNTLNNLLANQTDFSKMDVKEVIAQASKFKESGSYKLAIKYYEYAVKKADIKVISYVLPQITACYRKANMPKRVIDIMSFSKKKYGTTILTPVLLTSVAAAYCDLGEFDKAKICCDRAYAQSDGHASGELSLVYKRIKAQKK